MAITETEEVETYIENSWFMDCVINNEYVYLSRYGGKNTLCCYQE